MISAALLCLVVAIADGDTITARCPTDNAEHPYQQVKVRVSAIDAPERKQPFGQVSRQHLAALCFQQQATISPKTRDRYGRTVAEVECQGKNAGQEQVRAGLAWYYVRYGAGYGHLAGLEQDARAAGRGLWSEAGAVAPWEWRKVNSTAGHPAKAKGSGSTEATRVERAPIR